MKINPEIRTVLHDISKRSLQHANNPTGDYKYMRRILRVFDEHLTEEERVYTFKVMMEMIHYRSVMVDPDNMLMLSNIKLRTYMFIFLLSTLSMVVAAVLFKTNSTLNGAFELIARFVKLFSL